VPEHVPRFETEATLIEATQYKLAQARFFLRHLQDEAGKVVRQDPAAFGHYLSAFISSARSVPWVLQNEEKARYDAWLPIWEGSLTDDERELLKFTNERRKDEIHRKGSKMNLNWKYVSIYDLPTEQFRMFEGSTPVPPLTLTDARLSRPAVGFPVYSFEQGDKPNVLETCKSYLAYLEKFVEAFVKAHT
jgi:hypothetical protein